MAFSQQSSQEGEHIQSDGLGQLVGSMVGYGAWRGRDSLEVEKDRSYCSRPSEP